MARLGHEERRHPAPDDGDLLVILPEHAREFEEHAASGLHGAAVVVGGGVLLHPATSPEVFFSVPCRLAAHIGSNTWRRRKSAASSPLPFAFCRSR